MRWAAAGRSLAHCAARPRRVLPSPLARNFPTLDRAGVGLRKRAGYPGLEHALRSGHVGVGQACPFARTCSTHGGWARFLPVRAGQWPIEGVTNRGGRALCREGSSARFRDIPAGSPLSSCQDAPRSVAPSDAGASELR